MPYITPASAPPTGTCREILIPNDERMIAAVLGQILELIESANWEQTDGISVADTIAAWDTVLDSFAAQVECNPAGGAADYTLHSDITLAADAATYSLTGLDLLSGLDLIVTVRGLSTSGSRENLHWYLNGDTSAVYQNRVAWWQSALNIYNATTTSGLVVSALAKTTEIASLPGYAELLIPRWKDTATETIVHSFGNYDQGHSKSRVLYEIVGAIDEITFYSASGNLKTGTQIAVYARG